MRNMLLITATLFAALLSATAHAGFVPTDWKNSGDGLATLHEETGLEWLDLKQTGGKSINEVKALLDTTYVGWRMPTYEEIITLAVSLFPVIGNDPFARYAEYAAPGDQVQQHVVFGPNITGYTYGTYEKDNLTFMFGSKTTTNKIFFNYQSGTDLNWKRSYEGVYLVSDGGTTLSSTNDPSININNPNAPVNENVANVPVPAGLAGLGLLAFLLAARRRVNTVK